MLTDEARLRILCTNYSMKELSINVDEKFLIKIDAGATDEPSPSLVPIWQWCLDTEAVGAVFNLPDDRWATYLEETCSEIERAYQANQARFDLELGVRQATIVFNEV